MEHGSRRSPDDLDTTEEDAGSVIALPRREPLLGEPPERPPAVVLEFPSRRSRDAVPPRAGRDPPPRLAV